jgi:hypothetical protein
MITAYSRGHKIIYTGNGWIYADNGRKVNDMRPCARCGKYPLSTGEDVCLGHLDGVTSACCGHGVTETIRMG